jgi:two-component system chemotaxis sensor kinase CheA
MNQAKYAELFRTEAREQLAELETTLLAFEQHGYASSGDASRDRLPSEQAHVATLFRNTHTIKGMAASMGYRAVEQIAHALESLLDRVRRGERAASAEFIASLFEGADALRASVEDAVNGHGELLPDELTPLLQRLGASAPDAPTSGATLAPAGLTHGAHFDDNAASAAAAPAAATECLVDIRLTADCPLKGVRAMLVLARLEPLGTVRAVTPTQRAWQDDAFDGTFSISLFTVESPATLEAAARGAGDVARVTVRSAEARPSRAATADALRTVRVDRRRLDTLLDLVGELVITRDRLLRLAEEHDHSSTRALTRAAHDTARLIGALQDEVLQARMVPVGQVFDRFPRLVRDVARDLGKDVHFVTEGREIELDRALLDAIADPIVHLLRNALDHGIEDGESRRAAGKPPTGRLVLRAARDRAAVVIQVEDDGRGIDRDVIRTRAQTLGLIAPDATDIDDDALLQVLAHSGFSTARAVTAISGRGVGVDVVTTRVRALGGSLELETITGHGTVFTLRLPVTLAITRALLVQVAAETYAFPAAHVVEAVEYDAGTIVTTVERDRVRESLRLRDETIPIVHVRERFGLPRRIEDSYFAVVEVAGRRAALLVDALVAQQDIVVKSFDVVRGSAPWFSGATVLGDGTPALIVDLGSLT